MLKPWMITLADFPAELMNFGHFKTKKKHQTGSGEGIDPKLAAFLKLLIKQYFTTSTPSTSELNIHEHGFPTHTRKNYFLSDQMVGGSDFPPWRPRV